MQREESMELIFEVLEMQKRNKPTERTRKADEKKRVICLFIMFTPRVMVIKMLKMTQVLYILLMTAKKN